MLMTQSDLAYALNINIQDLKQIKWDVSMPRPANLVQIQARVAKRFNLTLTEIVGGQRSRRITRPRMIGYWLSSKLTTASLPQIGRIYNKDHTTIMYGIKVVESWRKHSIENEAQWYEAAESLLKEFSQQDAT